jgi:hypothetical protein
MALPLINQPALGGIKDGVGRKGATPQSPDFISRRPARGALYLSGASARYRG